MQNTTEEAVIPFDELSDRGNPMGRYHGTLVFASPDYFEKIKHGKTYYCQLSRGKGQFYNAVPLFEISLDRVMDENPELFSKIAMYLYQSNPSMFDSRISAVQMADIKRSVEERYAEKINYLEKDNERLKKELESSDKIVAQDMPIKSVEGIRDGMYYSDMLKDRYYSARINARKDCVLLVEDDNGAYGGHNGCICINDIKDMLGGEIKGEYCDRYGGIVFRNYCSSIENVR